MGFKFPQWAAWYKKPSYVDLKKFAMSFNEKVDNGSGSRPSSIISASSGGIPSTLALDRILKNKTCSPLSLFDFYMYLKYIELSPENLEFYMWFKDYQTRFAKEMGDVNSARADEASLAKDGLASYGTVSVSTEIDSTRAPILKEKSSFISRTDSTVDLVDEEKAQYADSMIYIESLISQTAPCATPTYSKHTQNPFTTYATKASTFNAELQNIASLFLAAGSQKELNIPSKMRKNTLQAIAKSPDPANLQAVADHVYLLLKSCSHRNFVRLGVSNGTFETVCMATGLGIVLTIAGFLCMILLAFASPSFRHANRWRGLGVIPFWCIGTSLIMSGMRGSCFFLLLFSRRQPLPWERFEDDSSVKSAPSGIMKFARKLMILDRLVRVKDSHLRNLQKKIVMQSMCAGIIFTIVMEVFFLALPIWK